jgi:PIN domain nuclease of toxin-antitoxin system
MKYLADTHLLLWAADGKLKGESEKIITDETNEIFFSSACIWEIAIKHSLGRSDFEYDPAYMLNGLLSADYQELPVISKHVLTLRLLLDIHKDPFDRIMIAQAIAENLIFITNDKTLAAYGGGVRYLEN